MKDKITIKEFAKLRGVTCETLRHYDRIGLLKPAYVDPNTGYRYYSILQYEKLGTIKELRQLGMSLKEIKQYFNNRNVNKSLEFLIKRHTELEKKLMDLKVLDDTISQKIQFLKRVINEVKTKEITIKEFEAREIITFNEKIQNNLELSYGFLQLENSLEEVAPILASNRFGIIISKSSLKSQNFDYIDGVFVFNRGKTKIDNKYIKKIPKGNYACIYYQGKIQDRINSIKELINYIHKNNYKISGDAFQIIQIDISVTDAFNEESFEIQIPIEKSTK